MQILLVFILLCPFWVCSAENTSLIISENVLSSDQANKLHIHRLVDGNSENLDDSWVVLMYPEVDQQGQSITELCISINSGPKKLASLCSAINKSEISGFNRSDFEIGEGVSVSADFTYGAVRYTLQNVLLLESEDYESFKERYNKPGDPEND
ncbi:MULTISPECIES: hypothetical protein [unclassified Pseudoalteromonas]|uniref:hypothetical protein n=1 Tax=unclassified Pseudoalteromonas TaxID=194690 RepID=UPI00073100DC|nr:MULTISPECIES: hypothetical protein [unclassified Pseudoalteromonas]KTD99123.1 hypothetical protein ATS71_00975 [Pseudoalteromonas sp. H71]TMN86054.1 hypothetical protein CWB64_02735 [Pseudoalteromonas sp. S410]TMN93379.1 hypothetical protein CWB62_02335 [Pseudoalteromonas sp. S408]TMN99873.1 hypothetical protein CWB61_05335 [Pseudoalteromonas sp. S407]TMO01859.1 hypothetical protein CWB63_03435 [Pseudoalteromonas sp. S409]|tara:strand:- start:955 stop:1413 length:459 start_codon:yes stop_codon:yes gene_type:complete